jgi:hypothetical protein
MNQLGGGYPVYLSDHTGQVTDVQTTLTYNPALLTVTPSSTANFTVTVPTAGTAVIHYSGPALAKGTQTVIGLLNATVPPGTPGNPTTYRAKDQLHFLGASLNGGGQAATTSDAMHVLAYVGDADGNGAYSSGDAVLITRALLETDTGFTAYPLIDPVIVADTDGAGFIPADAALQANEAGVGFPTTNLPVPPVPSGVNFVQVANNVDPAVSLPSSLQVGSAGTVTVPVNLDDAAPAGSTGLTRGHLALKYDPRILTVSPADVHAGSLLAVGDWSIVPTIDAATGQIGITLSSDTPIRAALGGNLVTIDFHQIGEPGASATGGMIELVASVDINGQSIRTELEDAQGSFTLTMAATQSMVSLAGSGLTETPGVQSSLHMISASSSHPAAGILEDAERRALPGVGADPATVGVAAIPASEQEIVSGPTPPETAALHVSAAAATSVASTIVSLAPLAGLVFSTPLPGAQAGSIPGWQHIAAQIFLALGRTDPALVGAVQTLERSLAAQILPLPPASDSIDGLDWDEVGAALDWRSAPSPMSHEGPAAQSTPPTLEPASSATALDQVFAGTADDVETPDSSE